MTKNNDFEMEITWYCKGSNFFTTNRTSYIISWKNWSLESLVGKFRKPQKRLSEKNMAFPEFSVHNVKETLQ